MDKETYEALKRVMLYLSGKKGAMEVMDTIQVNNWLDEVKKDYK